MGGIPIVGRAAELAALLELVERVIEDLSSARQPVPVVEDLPWGDAAMLALLRTLAETLRAKPRRAASPTVPDPLAALTPRELEVLALVAEGLTNPQIAGRLNMAAKTASVHVSAILAKLGAATRTQAAGLYVAARPAPLA